MKSSAFVFGKQITDVLDTDVPKIVPGFNFKIHKAPPNIVFKGAPIEYDFTLFADNFTPQRRPRGGVKERARRALRESYLIQTPIEEQKEQKEQKEQEKRRPRGGVKEREKRERKALYESQALALNLASSHSWRSQSPPKVVPEVDTSLSPRIIESLNTAVEIEPISTDAVELQPTKLPRPRYIQPKLSLNELEAKCKLSKLVWADEYSDTDSVN